jgi:hypothetical protein
MILKEHKIITLISLSKVSLRNQQKKTTHSLINLKEFYLKIDFKALLKLLLKNA